MPQIEPNVPLDEHIWQAWLRKNEAQDKIKFTRRVRVLTVVSLVVAVGALLWKVYAG